MERVAHLFRNVAVRPEARFLGAERTRPIERFVAAVAWWPEGQIARFQLACQPGVMRAEVARELLDQVAATAESAGLNSIQTADVLKDDDEWFRVLEELGFKRIRSERSFEVAYRDAWNRVMQLHQRYQEQIPRTWRTDPIRLHEPETVLELIAPHCLMPPVEVCKYWRAGAPPGFDAELSCVLFDGERPFGAFLLRRLGDLLYIDVQVVRQANLRLRSVGDLCLLYHDAQRVAPGGTIQRIQFRSGESEHRQTANLALRMGGRELARRHVLGKDLVVSHP